MSRFFCKEQDMKDLTFRQLQDYLLEHYQQSRAEEGLFIKLVEEVGEVAEVLNGRSGRKEGVKDSNEELAKELADIHSLHRRNCGHQRHRSNQDHL